MRRLYQRPLQGEKSQHRKQPVYIFTIVCFPLISTTTNKVNTVGFVAEPMPDKLAGIVLAGGFSTRFGDRDKALATVEGQPILVRVVDRVGSVVDTVIVNCRADQQAAFEDALAEVDTTVQFALDKEPDKGPLAGLSVALTTVDTPQTAVVACDMPWVDPEFLSALFETVDRHDGAVPKLPDGHLQPTQAVYKTDAIREAASTSLAKNRRSFHSAIDQLDVVIVSPETIENYTSWQSLRDINTSEELDDTG
jgi:molybdopterin-guanine dinucleotide biosynthesis protein A